jgi:catechol 2,3-dioxygenase-like lactoylglutathione lyase family enzyme
VLANHMPAGFIAVNDIDRALAFYRDTLGLDYKGFDGFAHRFRLGPINLRIVKPPQGAVIADYTVFGWETPDIAADVAALAAKGVEFNRYPFFGEDQDAAGIWTAPGGDKVAWFKDPDGNVLSLAQHV